MIRMAGVPQSDGDINLGGSVCFDLDIHQTRSKQVDAGVRSGYSNSNKNFI